MPAPTNSVSPAEQLQKDINSASLSIQSLQNKVTLSSVLDETEDIQTKVTGLKQQINNLRSTGYIFEKILEDNAVDLQKKWQAIQSGVKMKEYQESNSLKTDLRTIESQLALVQTNKNNIPYASKILAGLNVRVKNLEDKTTAVERTIRGMYNQLDKDLGTFLSHLKNIEQSFKDLNEACFTLLAQENLIQAVKAVWTKDGREDKNDPEGILYLTDQRMIFEQKEEVATKKVLFITTERKLIQECLFEFPVRAIQTIKATEQGVFKNKDFLDLLLSSEAPYHQIQFHLIGQDSGEWNSIINNVLNGTYDKDRTIPIDETVIEKIKNAPTNCPNCNGAITIEILRGMDQIHCEYCGTIIRL